jgi:predicted MFS family arabinose efflux permease
MWLATVVSTTGFALVLVGLPLPVAVAGAGLAGAGAPPFEPCLRVLWRDILPEDAVRSAYTLDIATQEMIFVVGPVVTLASVGAVGPAAGLVAAALLQIAGTVWFVTAPAVRRWRGVPAKRHWAGPLRSARLRVMLMAVLLIGTGLGSVIIAVAAYAEARGSNSWAGWLLAAQAVGALTGGLTWTRLRLTDNRHRLPLLAALMALASLPLLLQPIPGVMLVLMAVSGVMLPPVLTDTFLSVDATAPEGTAAEAFAWVATAFCVGSAAGSALTGPIVEASGSVLAGFAIAPVVIGLAAAAFWAAHALTPRDHEPRVMVDAV